MFCHRYVKGGATGLSKNLDGLCRNSICKRKRLVFKLRKVVSVKKVHFQSILVLLEYLWRPVSSLLSTEILDGSITKRIVFLFIFIGGFTQGSLKNLIVRTQCHTIYGLIPSVQLYRIKIYPLYGNFRVALKAELIVFWDELV